MNKIKAFFGKMKGDDKLVVSLVLIAIAIGLCIIFRNEINTIMTDVFKDLGSTIKELYEGTLSKTTNVTP